MWRVVSSCLLWIAIVLIAGTSVDAHARDVRGKMSARLARARQTRSLPGENPCLTITYLTELKKRFVQSLDHNNDGKATFDEVKDYMRRFKPNVKDAAVEAFIHRRDSNGNGVIDFIPEYIQDMTVSDYSMGGATEWFHLHDTNDDGFVGENELMSATQALGLSPAEAHDTVHGYYMAADLDGDGKLSFDEFKTLYNQ